MMAVKSNVIVEELIFHSDRGSQYASYAFTNIIKNYNGLVKQSMSRKGNCWDNAVAESFFKSLKVGWVYKHKYNLRSQAELSIFSWIETWYNKRRIHPTLGYKTIKEFEIEMYNQNVAAYISQLIVHFFIASSGLFFTNFWHKTMPLIFYLIPNFDSLYLNTMKKTITLSLLLFSFLFLRAQGKLVNNLESNYPYWAEYHKTSISEIQNPKWITKDHVVDGWDWSLPKTVKPSKHSNLCIARSFGLGSKKIEELPNINFSSNPVISHWVNWRDLEPKEGEINFAPLIKNIKMAFEKGYGSIVRIHFSAIDFAPEWIKNYNIPIRKEYKENPIKTNYDVSHPEFHKRYIKFVKALGESGIPHMKEVKGLFLGYASPSNGDEGIGPYSEKYATANDTVQHVRERIDTWANACAGVEHKVFMGGFSNYGLSKGFGVRRGFVEMYLYHIPDEDIGQRLDDQGYLYVDESNDIIDKNLFHGEENEEYEERWATAERDFRFGKNTNSFPYRYFTANLRLLQMRCNYLLNNEFSLLPEMFSWVSLELGRTKEDAPDAWCFLRESYIRGNEVRPVKNFERWVYQRDQPGYETKPVIKIEHPIEMWMVQPGKYYDLIARQGNKIGFDIDDTFLSSNKAFAVKISYLDAGKGNLSLVFQGKKGIEKRSVKNENTNKIKTATFFINGDFANKTLPFDLEIHGEDGFEPIISFLRIIKI